ncbi:tannase-domain-containing protein [Piedraia hortae CBS 480.64]|uniref:Carboxylic ester hydrolase n=1 Tax=Piedraia hortae CBS 480.64 TaxID=1314780 RepID=A0A6A7CA18_9PEZI|nr:tannase-domain-containing protein [Piedraia hortae CBS 480.64]
MRAGASLLLPLFAAAFAADPELNFYGLNAETSAAPCTSIVTPGQMSTPSIASTPKTSGTTLLKKPIVANSTAPAVGPTGTGLGGTGSVQRYAGETPKDSIIYETYVGTKSHVLEKRQAASCASLCSSLTTLNGYSVTPISCVQRSANTAVSVASGQANAQCGSSFTPTVDICQVTLNVKTSGTGSTYMEVWMPSGSQWNGRTMSTDNGGLNGCVHYVDMTYVSGLGFAAIGDNAGHNGSSFDGSWMLNNNEAIIDWSYRARHASVTLGKQIVSRYYGRGADWSYYIGCSAGGSQGLQSAQKYPNDFDGIISGASANDFNHLQAWSAHFRQLTGVRGNASFLEEADWTTVQSYIFAQCDQAIDGVNDGILEDPTLCKFDPSVIPVCSSTTTSGCLTSAQIQTVRSVFQPLYNAQNRLIYPALVLGSQIDAFRLGLLSGSIQGIAQDFFRGAVYNNSNFDVTKLSTTDYARADALDNLHGNPSAFNGDLSQFRSAGKKLIMYHGMADPMTSALNSQRYYQKVARTMNIDNTAMDDFLRFFRISGMAHCGVGGISGAGAWMFGQNGAASGAPNNIVQNLVDWVENGQAPDTLLGTKFWYDLPSLGIEFQRRHCRYPYRTTYVSGDSTDPNSWDCEYISNWQNCAGVTCNSDGTF